MKGTSVLVATWDRDPIRTAPRNRVCAHEDCGTLLSVYNPSAFCCLHDAAEAAVPDGFCRCTVCGTVLPWTPAYFHRDPAKGGPGLRRACKACRNHVNRKQRPLAPMPESKRCPHCGKTKRLDGHNWYGNKDGSHWASWCKVCSSAAARERWRAKSAAL